LILAAVKSSFLGYTSLMDETSTNQVEAQTESTTSKRPATVTWLLWFLLALLLYVFSVGPVNRLEQAGLIPYAVVRTVYAPIESFCLAHPSAFRCYFWYLHRWRVYLINIGNEQIPVL
jgi:hypothetical protein